MTATSCSVNSTSRSRAASRCVAPSASAGTHSGSSSGCGSSMTRAALPRDCCRVTATAGSSKRRESARTDDRSPPQPQSWRSARTGYAGRRWSERSAARPCLAPISSTWSALRRYPASDTTRSAVIRSFEILARYSRRRAMGPRAGRGLLMIILVLTLGIPPSFAQRGGRGGGARGGGGFVGGGMPRGGGGFAGGGMPRGGGGFTGGGSFSHSPAVSSPRPAQRPAFAGGAGGRPSTLPSGPSGGVGRPGVGPGAGRPSTLPAGPGLGNRPGTGGQPGIGNRPGVGGQPGIGNRPGVGGQLGIGDRPGAPRVSNLPANVNVNRPGGGTNVNRPVDPGYGVRPPAYNGWRGAYWGYHQGWANGYWHGYHDNSNWGWGSFAVGAAAGVTAWALGSSYYNWGYASYANPYYGEAAVAQPIVIEQTIAGGEPQTVSVP